MEKLLEAMKSLLPEGTDLKEISGAIDGLIKEANEKLESEYNEKLEEAYQQLAAELKEAEETAEKGYNEAWSIIESLRSRMSKQNEEFETFLQGEYESAYEEILKEKQKNEALEVRLHDEYKTKFEEMQEMIIDKLDEFLQTKGQEFHEEAKREVLSDPRLVEHKLTLNKVIDTISGYISEEDFNASAISKYDEVVRSNDELKGKVKLLEARNIRISNENTKLNEQVRQTAELLEESFKNEKNERVNLAKKVQGRGKQVLDNVEVISESNENNDNATKGNFNKEEMQILAGVKKLS